MNFETIAVRALNSCRNLYAPSYLGLRVFIDVLSKSKSLEWGDALIKRKILTRTRWRYHYFKGLKQIVKDSRPEYRNFCIGSPTTLLAESAILQFLSQQQNFQTHKSTYSYLWPRSKKSGRNFDYYINGYKRRNSVVTELLGKQKNNVALIFDIHRFYPSVSKEKLLDRFHKRLGEIEENSWKKNMFDFTSCLLDGSPQGIPIGPQIGHLLGHIALEDVDTKMYEKYGDNYLRYVDDIVLVCDKKRVDEAFNDLKTLLHEEGLKLNESKKDELSYEQWANNVPEIQDDANSFGNLLNYISVYLNRTPKSFTILKKTFQDKGFSLPFQRLKAMSQYNRYLTFIESISRKDGRSLRWLFNAYRMSNKDLLEMAMQISQNMLDSLMSMQKDFPEDGMKRRWHVQKLRYLINRLLYLLPPEQYSKLLKLTPDIDEFQETIALLKAFIDEDVTNLLNLPGRVIDAFCELWVENKTGMPKVDYGNNLSDVEGNSLEILHLFRVLEFTKDVAEKFNKEQKVMLQLCAGIPVDSNEIEPLSFADELRSLLLNYKTEERQSLLTTRFNLKESLSLGGLVLGKSESSTE